VAIRFSGRINMPIFSFRRDHDGSPEQRVAAIEESLAALIRVHKEEVARLEHRITVLWAMAVPAWIREAIPHAEALGWTIEPQTDCLKFCHLEFDDSCRRTKRHSFVSSGSCTSGSASLVRRLVSVMSEDRITLRCENGHDRLARGDTEARRYVGDVSDMPPDQVDLEDVALHGNDCPECGKPAYPVSAGSASPEHP